MARPAQLPEWASSGANTLEPSAGKKSAGWASGERPPAQWWNWWQRLVYDWTTYLDATVIANKAAIETTLAAARVTDAASTAGLLAAARAADATTTATLLAAARAADLAVQLADQVRDEVALENQSIWSLREVYRHTGWTLNSVAWGAQSLGALANIVLVGDNDALASAVSGGPFVARTPAASFTAGINDVCNGSLWVWVGNGGSIQSSSDTIGWTSRKSSGFNLNAVVYANNIFCAVGASGALYTSPDGITWTSRSSALGASDLVGIAYGAGLFVCISGDGKVQTSADGITWTSRHTLSGTSPSYIPRQIQYTVRHGFVAIFNANSGQAGLNRSSDGITWSQTTTAAAVGTEANLRIALLDRQVCFFDTPTGGTHDLVAMNYSSVPVTFPSIGGADRFLYSLPKCLPRGAKNMLGQVVVVGQAPGGDGVCYIGAPFRPNSTAGA